jgi:AcrR family transcriptional regulator
MSDRLTKDDWLRHGLRTLAQEGANALKVGPMAARLNVSRGSFYWHFSDISEFRSHLLLTWQERSTDQVIRELDAAKAGPGRLKHLMKQAFGARHDLDRAIRSWAAEDTDVAGIVAAVDARRVAYIAKLLAATGVQRKKALRRAVFLYWAYLGQAVVMDPRHASLADSDIEDIGNLLENS